MICKLVDTKKQEEGKGNSNKILVKYYSYKTCILSEIKHTRKRNERILIAIQSVSIKQ